MDQASVISQMAPAQLSSVATWKDYFILTKPTISLLVVVTVVPAILMAAPIALPSMILFTAVLIGTWLASSSAAIFNHLVDSDIDQQMVRTSRRPVASGRISNTKAAGFAIVLGALSFGILWKFATLNSALIAVAANFFYVVVYTAYLKRRTVQNIVIGGAAGAVGPLIGWAAIDGTVGWPAWVLFAVIFMWTPPHFWALALKYKDDYAKAKVPMMPCVKGDASTKLQMFLYTLTLIPLVVSLYWFGHAGLIYLVPSLLLTLYFSYLAGRLYFSGTNQLAMPLFHYSCLYLFGIFGSLMIDCLL
ncbi:MAG: heme o synthase [Proteobacteria bacterium]|nr:heme o synthase [Pseudomonadota bacterium]